jgi:hypothetical protein
MKGHYYTNELLIFINLSDSTYSIYENFLNIMKTAFIVAASTSTKTTTTIPAASPQQVATSPLLLDGLLVYAPLLPILIFCGSIIAALITRHGQWLIHHDGKEQKKRSENHIQTSEYIAELTKYWQNYLVKNSSLLYLEKDIRYHELIQNLSSSERDRLTRELVKCQEKLNDFNEIELPRLKAEAKKSVKHDRKRFEELTQLPAAASLESFLYFQRIKELKNEAREELEKPLRAFLSEELAKLISKNQL